MSECRSKALSAAFRRVARSRGHKEPRVVLTNNRSRMLSWRRAHKSLEVRVARRLLAVGDEVIEPIVGTVFGKAEASQALRDVIRALPPCPRRRSQSKVMTPEGEHYQLDRILAAQLQYLDHSLCRPVAITWGRQLTRRKRRRSIRLGSYDFESATIRIHRQLDHPSVPEWFVGFVVYHELLHHQLGVELRHGRRVVHSATFRALEALHPDYRRAMQWEERNLNRLLVSHPRPRA